MLSSIIEEKLQQHGLTQTDLAKALRVSRRTVNQLLNERRSLTVDMAGRLARFWETSPEFWLNLQLRDDLRVISTMQINPEIPTVQQYVQLRSP